MAFLCAAVVVAEFDRVVEVVDGRTTGAFAFEPEVAGGKGTRAA